MRILPIVFFLGAGLGAEPWGWAELPRPLQKLLAEAGLSSAEFPEWKREHQRQTAERLAAGAAEHIAYFVLQSGALGAGAALDPAKEARAYFESLPMARRKVFLGGKPVDEPMAAPVRRRMDAFWDGEPADARYRLLRGMALRLGWAPERVMQTAFRFLIERSETSDPDGLYQTRGLSADPYPPSMRAVEKGLAWLRAHGGPEVSAVLLAGPGLELGSRFGLDDSLPLVSPQPKALLALLAKKPAEFACVDVRPEVTESLAGGPCNPLMADVAADGLPRESFDLAVATNLLVYLGDRELGLAMGNFARTLRPGGCLLHNDSRFATRLFGEAAGIPVVHFEQVAVGRRAGREQVDRIVIHCKPVAVR